MTDGHQTGCSNCRILQDRLDSALEALHKKTIRLRSAEQQRDQALDELTGVKDIQVDIKR